jgi:hypothetical protein
MKCSKCGSENPADKRFCGDCGAALGIRARMEKQLHGVSATRLAEAMLPAGDLAATQAAAEEAIVLCRRTLRGTSEAIAHGVMARALMRRDGGAACKAVEATLASAAELIERAGPKTIAPALLEWRVELAGAPGHAERFARLL